MQAGLARSERRCTEDLERDNQSCGTRTSCRRRPRAAFKAKSGEARVATMWTYSVSHHPFRLHQAATRSAGSGSQYHLRSRCDFCSTWQAMESLVDDGKLPARPRPFGYHAGRPAANLRSGTNQAGRKRKVEAHPYLPETDLLQFCKQQTSCFWLLRLWVTE